MIKKTENFLKSFGMGLVYFFIFPFIIVFSFLYGIYGLLIFLLNSIGGIIRFFKGEEFFETLREDKEVKYILKVQHDSLLNGIPNKKEEEVKPSQPTQNVYVQNNYYSSSKENMNNLANTNNQINQQFQNPQNNPAIPHDNLKAAEIDFSANNPQIGVINNNIASQNSVPEIQKAPALTNFPTYSPNSSVTIDPLGGNDNDPR